MEVRFAQSARRHRVGRQRARDVIDDPIVVQHVTDERGTRTLYLGADHSGRDLEVVVVEKPDVLLVIHVMDLRDSYRTAYGYDAAKQEADHG